MIQNLPIGKFRWLTQDEIKKRDVNTILKENWDDCILEDDFEYSEKLHDIQNEKKESMLSDCCKEVTNRHNISFDKVKKLEANLSNNNTKVFSYITVRNKTFKKMLAFKEWLKNHIWI